MSDTIKSKHSIKEIILDPILAGINYMLPCVVAGGILMGLGYMFDDININPSTYGYNTELASFFSTTGSAIFSFMLPILSAYMGKHIGGNASLAAGFAGGYLVSVGNSGFLGAIFTGFLAGYTILLLRKVFIKLPETLAGIRDLLIFPLLSVIIMGIIALYVIEPVIGELNQAMNNALLSMSGSNKIILGAILGAMLGTDMGGPINKTAYLFATAALANGQYDIMSAVIVGCMIPPFVTAVSSTLFRNKFTNEERQTGYTNYIVGLAGITEAAIPFLAKDPIRVIPSCMIAGAVAGGLSMMFECTVMAPFGGIFILPLNSNMIGFVISLAAGTILGAVILGISKKKLS